jgi:peptide/nickel transport system substrate-binding protein
MRRVVSGVTGALLAASAMTAAELIVAPTTASAQSTLRIGNTAFGPRKGQVHWAFAAADVMPLMAIFDSLTYVDGEGKLQPGLASKWEARGNDTWIFTIRPGVTFHNGKPMDAAAVVANVEYILTDEGRTTSGGRMLNDFVITGRALDAQTVEIKTKVPQPIMDRWFALFRPMEVGAYKELGPDGFGLKPVGTGSFRVTAWTPEGIRAEAHPQAWRKPKVDRLVINELPENAARLQALTSGQIDIAWSLTPDDSARIRASGGTVAVSPVGDVVSMGFNLFKDGPFKDVRVRRALSHGVDRDGFVRNVLAGLTKPASHPAASHIAGHVPSIRPYAYDPARARALLAEAGYPNGLKAKIEIITSGDFGVAMQNLASDLGKIGVELELINLTIPEFIQRFIGQKAWDGTGISTIYEPFPTGDIMRALVTQSCTGRGNFICDRTIQPKIDAANVETDPAKRAALVTEVMQYYHDNALSLYLYEAIQVTGLAGNVRNYKMANRAPNYHEIELAR